MKEKLHIDEDILLAYCMNGLAQQERQQVEDACRQYPEIKKELERIEQSLEGYMGAKAIAPPAMLQEQIWEKLANINKEQKRDLNDLPVVNQYTDHKNWLAMVQPLLPEKVEEDRCLIPLRQTPQIAQTLVISKTDFEEEWHDDVYECFIILHGRCQCTIGDRVFQLTEGGFTDIPLHIKHHVQILSPYVIAILQHIPVSA